MCEYLGEQKTIFRFHFHFQLLILRAPTTVKLEMAFTSKNIEDYGNRLHINMYVNVPINILAIILILKYSTKAMGFYKYYNLMGVVGAFIMDIHTSYIFGIFALFPLPMTCAAGLSRKWGWLWGNVVNFVSFTLN